MRLSAVILGCAVPFMAGAQLQPAFIESYALTSGGFDKIDTAGPVASNYLSLNPPITENAAGGVFLGNVPLVHAYADMNGAGGSRTDATIMYELQVIGPQNVKVPVIAHVGLVSASVTRSGGAVNAYAFASAESRMWLTNRDVNQNTEDFSVAYRDHIIDQFGQPLDSGNDFVTDTHLNSRANMDVMKVTLDAYATTGAAVKGAGIAEAYLDPYFYIDPSFADAALYSIKLSPGIPNNPVPEPLPCLTLGVGVLAFCRRRRTAVPS